MSWLYLLGLDAIVFAERSVMSFLQIRQLASLRNTYCEIIHPSSMSQKMWANRFDTSLSWLRECPNGFEVLLTGPALRKDR